MPKDSKKARNITDKLIESLLTNLSANQSLLSDMVQQQKSVASSLAEFTADIRQMTDKLNYIFNIPADTKAAMEETLREIRASLTEARERHDQFNLTMFEHNSAHSKDLIAVQESILKHIDAIVSASKTEQNASEIRIVKNIFLRMSLLTGGIVTLLGLLVFLVEWISKLRG